MAVVNAAEAWAALYGKCRGRFEEWAEAQRVLDAAVAEWHAYRGKKEQR